MPSSISPLSILMQAIHARFPREIRDQVYSHLWDESTVRSLNEPFLLTTSPSNTAFRIPAWANINLISHSIVEELVESLYETTPFLAVDSTCLKFWLKKDLFRVSTIAGTTTSASKCEKLRQLIVDIDVPEDFWSDDTQLDDIPARFTPLLNGKLHRGFQLHIRIQHRWGGGNNVPRLVCIIDGLKSVVDAFEKKGVEVTVRYVKHEFLERVFEIDVKHMIGATGAQWAAFMIGEIRAGTIPVGLIVEEAYRPSQNTVWAEDCST